MVQDQVTANLKFPTVFFYLTTIYYTSTIPDKSEAYGSGIILAMLD